MQIFLHTDPNVHGTQLMAKHLHDVVTEAMNRFGERITRVDAFLSNAHSSLKATTELDILCTLEARLVGLDAVIVKVQESNAHQAIDHALKKLLRAVDTQIDKHAPQHHRPSGSLVEGQSDPDMPPDLKE
jgi:ribosome-associated translation inhibitor RaiA